MTAHDGFTLRDLVSYNEKHNEANGEENRDGESHNLSWNCGVEGETDDPRILELRARQMRNVMTMLFVSQGVPMILHGDELGRTQRGNNNAYCQDNELTWQSWEPTSEQRTMLRWTRRMIRLRKLHSILRRRDFFRGRAIVGAGTKDIAWLNPDGREMSAAEWSDASLRALGVYLAGIAADVTDDEGHPIVADSLLLLFNSSDETVQFRLPSPGRGRRWRFVADTTLPDEAEHGNGGRRGLRLYSVGPRSAAVLAHHS